MGITSGASSNFGSPLVPDNQSYTHAAVGAEQGLGCFNQGLVTTLPDSRGVPECDYMHAHALYDLP